MTTDTPDEMLVYLFCKGIINGDVAQLSQQKQIISHLKKYRKSIKPLSDDFSTIKIAKVVEKLLRENVFDSPSVAKSRFPELFPASEADKVDVDASEADAVTAVSVETSAGVFTPDEDGSYTLDFVDGHHGLKYANNKDLHDPEIDTLNSAVTDAQIKSISQRVDSIVCAPSIRLPFKYQHRILVKVQSLLETCCFDFGNEKTPHLMNQQNWHDAESIELARWIQAYTDNMNNLSLGDRKILPSKFPVKIHDGLAKLRRSTVQRISIDMAEMFGIFEAAVEFARLLNGSKGAARILEIKQNFQSTRNELDQQQNVLKEKLITELTLVARQRTELDERETKAIEATQKLGELQRTEAFHALGNSFLDVTIDCNLSAPMQAVMAKEAKGEEGILNGKKTSSSAIRDICP